MGQQFLLDSSPQPTTTLQAHLLAPQGMFVVRAPEYVLTVRYLLQRSTTVRCTLIKFADEVVTTLPRSQTSHSFEIWRSNN